MADPKDIPAVERAADKEGKRALDEYERGKQLQDELDQAIADYANLLRQPLQKCDPWEAENFYEAMQHAPEPIRHYVFANILAAVLANAGDGYLNATTIINIRNLVEDYWLDMSITIARRELEPSYEPEGK